MPRRTKEELRLARQDKRLDEIISSNKFLRDEKYYKNNYWSMAAWDSWAAQGKAGGCHGCHENYYSGTLHNIRASTKVGGGKRWCKEVSGNFCHDCIVKIETKLKIQFKRRH